MARGTIRRKSKETVVQPKLKVGQPGDKYEQEADAVADQVVANHAPSPAVQMAPSDEEAIAMRSDEETVRMNSDEEQVAMSPEDEDHISMKEDEEVALKEDDDQISLQEDEQVEMKSDEELSLMKDEEKVAAKEEDEVSMKEDEIKRTPAIQKSGDGTSYAAPAIAQQIQNTKGQGSHLAKGTQQELGQKMGADFSKVKIHSDQNAASLNDSLGAKAFAHGQDIYFNKGNYDPGSSKGKHLLAHELTHVMQQKSDTVQRKIEVPAGTELDTMGYTHSQSGNVYTAPRVSKKVLFTEIFTAMLASQRIFKLAGATSEEVNKNLKVHVQARKGVVSFASKKKYDFGAGNALRMNSDFWEVTGSNYKLKEGVDSQAAMDDMNVNPGKYAMACYLATHFTMLGGGGPYKKNTGSKDDLWVPGDWGYIDNPSHSGILGLEGENIIYMGNDLFWGHFTGSKTLKPLESWIATVEGWDGAAVLLSERDMPAAGLQ